MRKHNRVNAKKRKRAHLKKEDLEAKLLIPLTGIMTVFLVDTALFAHDLLADVKELN